MPTGQAQRPDWDALYRQAVSQAGYLTAAQATDVGYSHQLLSHHVLAGRFVRVRRGIYRLVHFPEGEHEELVPYWLWSERQGVFSHKTALRLHGLLDGGGDSVDMAVPEAWRKRRLKIPEGLVCHYADVPAEKRTRVGCLPVVSAAQTIYDCADAGLSVPLLTEAVDRGALRRVFAADEVEGVARYVLDRLQGGRA